MALDALHRSVFPQQGELGVPVVHKLGGADLPGVRGEMALRAVPGELAAVRILVAIRTLGLESAELGQAQRFAKLGGPVALLAGYLRVFGDQRELRILVMIKIQIPSAPTFGRVAVGAAGRELFAVGILMASGTIPGQTLELCKTKAIRGTGWLVALVTFD